MAIASQSTLPELPALKNLSAASPVIAVDSREQDALKFTHLKSVVVTLTTADYSLVGGEWAVAIERKGSIDVLLNRARPF